jgi:hypothetical protein
MSVSTASDFSVPDFSVRLPDLFPTNWMLFPPREPRSALPLAPLQQNPRIRNSLNHAAWNCDVAAPRQSTGERLRPPRSGKARLSTTSH